MRKQEIFSGSYALVTGASSGIGEQFARELAHRGANLVLTARSREKLEALAADLARVNGVKAHAIVSDLSKPDGAFELVQRVRELGVFVAHLVNNAGFGSAGRFVETDPEREARMVRVNCEAVVVLARSFLPPMVARRQGGVLNVASTAGHQPTPFMATYGATKAFVLSFSLALAEELRGSGVRALALCPGPVPTGFQAAASIPSGAVLSIAKLDAHGVAERALDAYVRREALHTPGLINSVQTVASKLLPRGLVVRAAAATLTKLGRVGS